MSTRQRYAVVLAVLKAERNRLEQEEQQVHKELAQLKGAPVSPEFSSAVKHARDVENLVEHLMVTRARLEQVHHLYGLLVEALDLGEDADEDAPRDYSEKPMRALRG